MWHRLLHNLRLIDWKQWLVGGLILLLGVGIGHWWGQQKLSMLAGTGRQLRDTTSGYTFISPLLAYVSPDKALFKELQGLEAQLNQTAGRAIANNKAREISVYFRDLQTGHWTGINEEAKFAPASLFKVPVMLALFKEAETNPSLLTKKIRYSHVSKGEPTEYSSSTTTQLKFGQYYTVDQLIEAMIVDSDNDSKTLLVSMVNPDIITKLFGELDMDVMAKWMQGENYQVSARQYSLLFRILYNATFLNESMSDKALALLSRSSFSKGLTAQLPATVKVAHKFGIYPSATVDGNELHDCGIVYEADKPYFACVMTRGGNFDDLMATVGKLSLVMYNFVHSS